MFPPKYTETVIDISSIEQNLRALLYVRGKRKGRRKRKRKRCSHVQRKHKHSETRTRIQTSQHDGRCKRAGGVIRLIFYLWPRRRNRRIQGHRETKKKICMGPTNDKVPGDYQAESVTSDE